MKKDRIIENEDSEVISDFKILTSINSKSAHPLVVEEEDETYRIVKDFSDSALATSQLLSSVNNTELESAGEEDIVYAEEIIDDDDDLYEDELRDREFEKQRHKSYSEIAKEIDEKLELNGWHGTIGFNLLAAMKFSRFLYFKNRDSLYDEIKGLIYTLDFPFHEVRAENLTTIADDEAILDVLAAAKKNDFRPYFIYVGEIAYDKVFEFFRPVYNYIDNPDGDAFLQSNGRNVYLPHNLFFIYTIKDHKNYFDISRRLLRYSAIVDGELIPVEAKDGDLNKMIISFDQLNAAFMEADSEYEISEDSWRKIDNFANAISQVNYYKLQNKIVRRLENYMILCLANGKREEEVVDTCLAYNFISEAIVTKEPAKYFNEFSLSEMLEDSFDGFQMSKCKEVIAAYLDLFDKKGVRKVDE